MSESKRSIAVNSYLLEIGSPESITSLGRLIRDTVRDVKLSWSIADPLSSATVPVIGWSPAPPSTNGDIDGEGDDRWDDEVKEASKPVIHGGPETFGISSQNDSPSESASPRRLAMSPEPAIVSGRPDRAADWNRSIQAEHSPVDPVGKSGTTRFTMADDTTSVTSILPVGPIPSHDLRNHGVRPAPPLDSSNPAFVRGSSGEVGSLPDPKMPSSRLPGSDPPLENRCPPSMPVPDPFRISARIPSRPESQASERTGGSNEGQSSELCPIEPRHASGPRIATADPLTEGSIERILEMLTLLMGRSKLYLPLARQRN